MGFLFYKESSFILRIEIHSGGRRVFHPLNVTDRVHQKSVAENLIIHVIMGIIEDKLSFRKPRGTCSKTCIICCTKLLNSSLESDKEVSFLKILAIREYVFPVISIID